jgi:hypothetical protein
MREKRANFDRKKTGIGLFNSYVSFTIIAAMTLPKRIAISLTEYPGITL